jgi:hypothetical protein
MEILEIIRSAASRILDGIRDDLGACLRGKRALALDCEACSENLIAT